MARYNPVSALPQRHIAGPPKSIAIMRQGLHAARVGASICGWINGAVGLNALTVVNDGNIYYNLPNGHRVVITMICAGLNTISDQIDFDIGYTDQPNAAGNYYQMTPIKRYASPANKQFGLDYEIIFSIPLIVPYSWGARCITMRVQANDALAAVDLGWQGWLEKEQ